DRLLETTEHPLHRRILENYRRHAILEICGEWEGIFDPEMCVEHPVYYFNITGMDGLVADGANAVKEIYRTLAETQTCVMLVEDEQLWVNDWGFASNSMFVTYQGGHDLEAKGFEIDDPDGCYCEYQHFAMIWPYDEQARLKGEHVYENKALHHIEPIPQADFITLDDARARLLPLLRPLRALESTGAA
ncbi:MAG: hypothetical protein ACYDHH_03415, partial [Solirubrobacteraceae bacterium]